MGHEMDRDIAFEHGMQMRNYRMLGALLEQYKDLPALDWRVGVWSLVGVADSPVDGQRRPDFEAWVKALGVKPRPGYTDSDGCTHLFAHTSRPFGMRDVNIVIRADVWPESESSPTSPGDDPTPSPTVPKPNALDS